MDLRAYTSELPHGGMAALAAKLGIKPIYLSQLAAKQDGREPSPQLCVDIERETSGVVRRWDLRHDWHRIWPELIGADGAPPMPAAAAQTATEAAPPARPAVAKLTEAPAARQHVERSKEERRKHVTLINLEPDPRKGERRASDKPSCAAGA